MTNRSNSSRRSSFTKRLSMVLLASIMIITSLFTSLPIESQTASANEGDDWSYVPRNSCTKEEATDTRSLDSDGPTDIDNKGDWLTPGSEAYANAEEIFDLLTGTYGASGEFAAGVLSNVKQESGFIPDRAEGIGELKFGMDNKNMPGGGGPGGGLFQFTPHTKYTNGKFGNETHISGASKGSDYWGANGGDGWDIENQVAGVWDLEFANKVVMVYLDMAASTPARNPSGYQAYSSVEDWLSTDDEVRASWAFQSGYERPAVYHSEREADAKAANKVFNSEGIKADPSKFLFAGDSGGGDGSTVVDGTESLGDAKEKSKHAEDCGLVEGKDDDSGAGWGEDGTGAHGMDVSTKIQWTVDEFPEELKKYALNPEDVGMTNGSSDGWMTGAGMVWPSGGQCTNLSQSLMGALWYKDGKPAEGQVSTNTSNGYATADTMAGNWGGSVTKDPKKGAVFQTPAFADGTIGYGHTGVVAHVFENGDFLIIEQNTPKSGDMINDPYTWNYALYKGSYGSSVGMEYYYPGDNGWEPHPKYKSSGGSKSDDDEDDTSDEDTSDEE